MRSCLGMYAICLCWRRVSFSLAWAEQPCFEMQAVVARATERGRGLAGGWTAARHVSGLRTWIIYRDLPYSNRYTDLSMGEQAI